MTYLLDQTGHFVSQEHSRVAELIQEYSPELSLVWIPPEQRELDEQFPFAILHSPAGKEPYIVRKVQMCDMNESLIAWLYHSEHKGNLNSWLDAQEAAQKAWNTKAIEESKAEMQDFMSSVLKGKNWYRHRGVVYS